MHIVILITQTVITYPPLISSPPLPRPPSPLPRSPLYPLQACPRAPWATEGLSVQALALLLAPAVGPIIVNVCTNQYIKID